MLPRADRRRPLVIATAVVSAAVLVAAATLVIVRHDRHTSHVSAAPPGTTTTTASTTTTTVAPTTTTAAPAVAQPPVAPAGWRPCGGSLQCATVMVPVDYTNPSSPLIGIAVERRPALVPSERIGALVLNPGGPGDSGINALSSQLRILTAGVQDRFDIVDFDPRGVNRSDPVHCQASVSAGLLPMQPDPAPQTDQTRRALIAADTDYAQACQKYTGPLLGFVGTDNTARDLDRIREALGEPQLTFMGQSYGTYLGLVYAELFPTHVRALVLDGVIDPALSIEDMATAQAEGFDRALGTFGSWCASNSSCPWRPGTSDTAQAFLSLVDSARQHPLPGANGRQAGPSEMYIGALGTLYSQTEWPALGQALAAAAGGNGAPIQRLSDAYIAHGSVNASDANNAINCVDHPAPRDMSSYPQQAATAGQSAPVFGPVFAWGAAQCGVWPVAPTRSPHAIAAPGTPPVLVVGTTQDPATPYAWAQSVSHELASAALLTRQGDQHVAYFYSACVRAAIERYLIAGTLPAPGTVCS